MEIPLSIDDINNIFTSLSITLLITILLINPYYGKISVSITGKKLYNSLLVTVALFLLALAIRVYDQVLFG